MDLFFILINLVVALIGTHYLLTLLKRTKLNPERQPPGPFPWPIIGNLVGLNFSRPHKSFAELAKTHGPVMLLTLGLRPVLVVSSPSMAREVLRAHDTEFAGRNIPNAGTSFDHHVSSIVLLPANAKWRVFRKICTTLVFSGERLDATSSIRRVKLHQLASYVKECNKSGKVVNMGQAAFRTAFESLANTFFSRDLVEIGSTEAAKLKDLIWGMLYEVRGFDVAELFPMLKMVDPQGAKRRVDSYLPKLIQIFVGIIDQRLEQRRSESPMSNTDVLDALLDLSDDPISGLEQHEIPHLLTDLFIAGTETTSSTLEWTMTELLRHPEKMQKAQIELDQVIGMGCPLKEADLSRLPYLRAVVKETFRLHPPTPFLVPRQVFNKTKLGDFMIPKNTMVLVNVWAMGRDNEVWSNADIFEPERFLDSKIDFKGQDFELIPFGSGRRMCPGSALANRILHMMLGTLIHEVNWKLEDGMKPEDIDVNDKFGFGIQKVQPMCAIPILKTNSTMVF